METVFFLPVAFSVEFLRFFKDFSVNNHQIPMANGLVFSPVVGKSLYIKAIRNIASVNSMKICSCHGDKAANNIIVICKKCHIET